LVAGLAPGRRLLDPFCGAGTVVVEALLAEPAGEATGTDVDAAMVSLAEANAAAAGVSAHFAATDAAALPLASSSVDRVATNPPWGEAVKLEGAIRAAWLDIARVLSADPRIAVIGPDRLIEAVGAELGKTAALRQELRVLGQRVEVALFAGEASFAAAGALYGHELDSAHNRFAS
jgi:tRNA G10  N-methylase Trm11